MRSCIQVQLVCVHQVLGKPSQDLCGYQGNGLKGDEGGPLFLLGLQVPLRLLAVSVLSPAVIVILSSLGPLPTGNSGTHSLLSASLNHVQTLNSCVRRWIGGMPCLCWMAGSGPVWP